MECTEIFKHLASHSVKGLMIHDAMSQAFRFLGLEGFAMQQDRRFRDESEEYRAILKFWSEHYNRLLEREDPGDVSVIPSSWFSYTRQQVDEGTKKSAVRTLLHQWEEWEKSTKKLCEDMYAELLSNKSAVSAKKILYRLCSTDRELISLQKIILAGDSVGYSIDWIISKDEELKKEYS